MKRKWEVQLGGEDVSRFGEGRVERWNKSLGVIPPLDLASWVGGLDEEFQESLCARLPKEDVRGLVAWGYWRFWVQCEKGVLIFIFYHSLLSNIRAICSDIH